MAWSISACRKMPALWTSWCVSTMSCGRSQLLPKRDDQVTLREHVSGVRADACFASEGTVIMDLEACTR